MDIHPEQLSSRRQQQVRAPDPTVRWIRNHADLVHRWGPPPPACMETLNWISRVMLHEQSSDGQVHGRHKQGFRIAVGFLISARNAIEHELRDDLATEEQRASKLRSPCRQQQVRTIDPTVRSSRDHADLVHRWVPPPPDCVETLNWLRCGLLHEEASEEQKFGRHEQGFRILLTFLIAARDAIEHEQQRINQAGSLFSQWRGTREDLVWSSFDNSWITDDDDDDDDPSTFFYYG